MARILFIDDEVDLINLYKFYLRDFDCELVTLTRGVEAYIEVIDTKFDLIVSDLKMPEMSGEEFLLEIIDGENKKTPILVISGHLDDFLQEELSKLGEGEIQFLHKPFTREHLINKIQELIPLKIKKKELSAA